MCKDMNMPSWVSHNSNLHYTSLHHLIHELGVGEEFKCGLSNIVVSNVTFEGFNGHTNTCSCNLYLLKMC